MSTKIYNGYRYRSTDGSPADVFRLAQTLRDTLQPVITDAYRHRVVELAVKRIDFGHDDNPTSTPIIAAELELVAAARKIASTGHRDPRNDFTCRIAVLPDTDNVNDLYLLTYCEVGIDDAMANIAGIDEYCYYNNTDKPDRVDAGTWDERARCWDRVLGYDSPAARGLICELEDRTFDAVLGNRDALAAHIPDRFTRARRIAERRAIDNAVADTTGEDVSAIIAAAERARRNAAADHATIAAIADTLDDITVADLYREHR